MKKTKLLIAGIALTGMMSSCMTTTYMVTDNPVGNKVGTAKSRLLFNKNIDYSLEKAATNGGIKKIGTAEIKVKTVLIFSTVTTTVTGE